MQTVFIFDSCGAEYIKFHVAEGDYSRFNGVFINLMGNSEYECLSAELCEYVYDEDGAEKISFIDEFPCQAVKDGAIVIVCGFNP